ncbi:MRN complex-interacting protein [Erpetoichthys calabaricus]|uniref:MRN complex interacting protein n=1 Tax=Erpetoichthys calabaricus TaxID=27687 RepID=A0A8C4SD96_ERPCA|nr:MRN complex-interacting protein [Erpetoichthys calabaricus]
MAQIFQVLRCFSCKMFQVHQVKKSKKWSCKLCGEKQSLQKVYGQGTGAECRQHVQKLNKIQGESIMSSEFNERQQQEDFFESQSPEDLNTVSHKDKNIDSNASRWNKYLSSTEQQAVDECLPLLTEGTDLYLDRDEFYSAKCAQRKHKQSRKFFAESPSLNQKGICCKKTQEKCLDKVVPLLQRTEESKSLSEETKQPSCYTKATAVSNDLFDSIALPKPSKWNAYSRKSIHEEIPAATKLCIYGPQEVSCNTADFLPQTNLVANSKLAQFPLNCPEFCTQFIDKVSKQVLQGPSPSTLPSVCQQPSLSLALPISSQSPSTPLSQPHFSALFQTDEDFEECV